MPAHIKYGSGYESKNGRFNAGSLAQTDQKKTRDALSKLARLDVEEGAVDGVAGAFC